MVFVGGGDKELSEMFKCFTIALRVRNDIGYLDAQSGHFWTALADVDVPARNEHMPLKNSGYCVRFEVEC